MDEFKKKVILARLEKAAEALRAHRMEAEIVENKEQLLQRIQEMVPEGASICSGGSVTLQETGIIDLLKSGRYDYYYRGRTDENGEVMDVLRRAFTADWYFLSSNAITMDGCLFNIDGQSNRVAALTFGPKHVIVVAGYNKLVNTVQDAYQRVLDIAAAANSVRLGVEAEQMCCTTAIHGLQRIQGRIHVFLLPEELGY